jgi:hypothetical protein
LGNAPSDARTLEAAMHIEAEVAKVILSIATSA